MQKLCGDFTFILGSSKAGHFCLNRRSGLLFVILATLIVSCSDSGTGPEPPGLDEFMKNYIEAIFLGTEPFIPQDNFTACVTHQGKWTGFPWGTTVKVIVSTTLDLGSDGVDTKQLIEAALATINEATLGEIQTEFITTENPDPMPGLNEATGTDHPSPQDAGCAFDRGCVHMISPKREAV